MAKTPEELQREANRLEAKELLKEALSEFVTEQNAARTKEGEQAKEQQNKTGGSFFNRMFGDF